jgi:hypothetical protein
MLGHPPIKAISELPYHKTKAKTAYKKKDNAIKLVWSGFIEKASHSYSSRTHTHRVFSRLCWAESEIDMNAGGFYVPVERFAISNNGRVVTNFDLFLEAAMRFNLIDRNISIIGLNDKDVAKIANNSNWINLFTEIKANFDLANANNELINRTVAHDVSESGISGFRQLNTYMFNRWSKLEDTMVDGAFKQIVSKMVNVLSCGSDFASSIDILMECLGVVNKRARDGNKLAEEWYATIKQYKMLRYIDWSDISTDSVNDVIEYINAIEQTNSVHVEATDIEK